MTKNQHPAEQSPEQATAPEPEWIEDADYRAARAASWETTVQALTTAARLRDRTTLAGQYAGSGRQLDFAEFVTDVLATVAANVGGVGQLLAGRPGSWEASGVEDLLRSTVGDDDTHLIGYRTEPVRIYLSVSRLVTWAGTDPFDVEYWAAGTRLSALPEGLRWELYAEADEADETDREAVRARWATRYQEYAARFTAAVHHAAAEQLPGLNVPVEVTATWAPDGEGDDDTADHPTQWEGDTGYDPLAWQLWAAALTAVPVPADWYTPLRAAGDQA